MTRNDTLKAIAASVRHDGWSAIFAVGYLAADASTEVLEALLAALQERPGPVAPTAHLEAYAERWGRLPE
jgi:hypothetical protein